MLLLTSHRIARQTENSENWDPLVQQSESGAAHNLGSRDMCRCLFTLLPSWKRTHFMCAELIFSRSYILHTPTSPTLQQSLLFSILNVDSVEVWLDDGISSSLAQGNPRYLFIHHHFNCQCFDPEWITVDFITAPLSCELCLLFPFQPNRITRGNLQIVKSVNLSATGDWGRAIKSPTRSHSVVVSEISTTTEQKKNGFGFVYGDNIYFLCFTDSTNSRRVRIAPLLLTLAMHPTWPTDHRRASSHGCFPLQVFRFLSFSRHLLLPCFDTANRIYNHLYVFRTS